jgi:transcriptional regulator with XRE-family HTH domain
MNFPEKLRSLRKQFNFSQEHLAEKIGVSRQAVTKWETDGGLPDIENLMAIAVLFSVSMDDLLSEEKLERAAGEYAYQSITEYDISRPLHFDISAPGALEISLDATENEKLRICLASNVLQTLPRDYKVKLDEHKDRLDVDISRIGESSETAGKEALFIRILLPRRYCREVELSAVCGILRLNGTEFPCELDGKVKNVYLQGVTGALALNCNTDMEIWADELPALLGVNQINATSALRISQDKDFYVKVKGKTNRVLHSIAGKPAQPPEGLNRERRIELTGMNAELIIDRKG